MTPEDFKRLPIIERLEKLAGILISRDSSDSIKKELGLSRYELSHLKRLDKHLSETSKQLIHKNKLSEGHAKALARLRGSQQDKLLRDTIQKRWSVRVLEQAVSAQLDGEEFNDRSTDALYYEQLSNHVSEQIGHPAKIFPDKTQGNGQITITYYGLDSFDGILKRLRVKLPDDM